MTSTLYKSLVRSLLEYCCPLWDPVKMTEIQLLEGVQRTFTNRIGCLEIMKYRERLSHLKLMSTQKGAVYHSDDIKDPSQCCPQLQQYQVHKYIQTWYPSNHPFPV